MYQKAYVEFFCSPELLEQLLAKLQPLPRVSYIAVNREGDYKSNMDPDAANAVTWGVFPGKPRLWCLWCWAMEMVLW